MNFKKIFIVGAGPAGLSCSYYLSKLNYEVQTFEQNEYVGGLARSWNWNGFNLDTGPHIFHTPIKEIEEDWIKLFNDLIIEKDFYACNYRDEKYYDYPLNLEQLDQYNEFQKDVKELRNKKNIGDLASATSFEEYVNQLVGENLSKAFFKEYPEKLWGIKTNEMSSEWAPKRIRLTNKKEKFFGNEFTAIGKRGTGEVMERLKIEAEKNQCKVYTKCRILGLSIKNSNNILTIDAIKTSTLGEIKVDDNDLVILTIPITKALGLIGKSIDLKFRGTLSLYLELNKKIDIIPEKYDWLYFQNKNNLVNRLCSPTNWSNKIDITGKNRHLLAAEISVDSDIKSTELKGIIKDGYNYLEKIINKRKGKIINWTYNLERFVYPVKMLNSKEKVAKAKRLFAEITNVEILGTGANFNYGDMQIMFLKAKELSKEISQKTEDSLSKVSFIQRYKNGIYNEIDNRRSINIIAELGINHNGSKEELHKLIMEASKSGAKYIKFQHYKEEERINKNSIENKLVEKAQDIEETTFEILEENQLSMSQLLEAKKITEKCGSIAMTTVFGKGSLKEAISLGFRNIKVASMDLNNFELHESIISYEEKIDNIFISTGMSSMNEIINTLNIYKGSNISPIVLACTSAYPSADEDLNLLNIKTYKKDFKDLSKDIGYSDHSIGNTACIVAASLGANYLEVHFTNSNKTRGPDHILSATPDELKNLRIELNRIEQMMGSSLKVPRPAEYETWRLQKKGLYAKVNILKGEKISLNNLEMRSPPYGMLSSNFLNKNYYASEDIFAGEILSSNNISSIEKDNKKIEVLLSIDKAKENAIYKNKKLIFVFVNTRNKNDQSPFLGGIRESVDFILINLVNFSFEDIKEINPKVQHYSDFIFLDQEKTSQNENMEEDSTYKIYLENFKTSNQKEVHPIKPSKLTVNAAISLIKSQFQSISKIGILGLGSIGFRLAQELFEENYKINIYSNNIKNTIKKIEVIRFLNNHRDKDRIQKVGKINQLINNSEVLILCSSEDKVIDVKDFLRIRQYPKLILDIGKNNLTKNAISFCIRKNIKILRLDIGNELIKEIVSYLEDMKREKIQPKRIKEKNNFYVSGGYIGQEGDYVVDDADNPLIIYGRINSEGKLSKNNKFKS